MIHWQADIGHILSAEPQSYVPYHHEAITGDNRLLPVGGTIT